MPWPTQRRILGTRVPRLDGPVKATGRARYAYDYNPDQLLHARTVRCPHAHARVKNIDTTAAEKITGFAALHIMVKPGEELFYAGQEIVTIACDTEEHAEDAIRAVRVDYEVLPFFVKEADSLTAKELTVPRAPNDKTNASLANESTSPKYDAQTSYQGTAQTHEGRYGAAIISHQCLESHGCVASWDKDAQNLTVYASTQMVSELANNLAQHFKMTRKNVHVVCQFMGGGFGSKFWPDLQAITAAELSRKARKPVKLMLDRAEEVTLGGTRPSAYGTVKMAATKEGAIKVYEVDCNGSPGVGRGATVNLTGGLPYVYVMNPEVQWKRKVTVVRINAQSARAMRAPGHPQNCILTDQALDDLAAKLNINPLEMRLRNLPPNVGKPMGLPEFETVRNDIYREQLTLLRKMSDWDKIWHAPGRGEGGVIKTGIGMALHTWGGAGRASNQTRVTINPNGSVVTQCSTQDLGTAQRTLSAIVVAEILGLQVADITSQLGDSVMGNSTPSGGSTTAPGCAPAALNAAEAAKTALLAALAGRFNVQAADLTIEPGVIVNRANNNARIPWRDACAKLTEPVTATGDWTAGLSNNGVGGVQAAEVKVDTETGVVRCTRFWAIQDCGLVVNKQGCESQVAGGVIMGLNYAMFEECIYDRVTGRQVNPDMEFYKLGGIQDMPRIYVHMMDMPERGVIGIGEPPTIGTAAAIGNAIFNAIGVRVADTPYTPERVLAALGAAKK